MKFDWIKWERSYHAFLVVMCLIIAFYAGQFKRQADIENMLNDVVFVTSSEQIKEGRYEIILCNLEHTCLTIQRNQPAELYKAYIYNLEE